MYTSTDFYFSLETGDQEVQILPKQSTNLFWVKVAPAKSQAAELCIFTRSYKDAQFLAETLKWLERKEEERGEVPRYE